MDQSHLDRKYFIDDGAYNCPFCNRNHVTYELSDHGEFDWNNSKKCHYFVVECGSCGKQSMHLSFTDLTERGHMQQRMKRGQDIDDQVFYSQPTSFFVLDNRIPRMLRELITEAEGCLKMNFLTGASACMRKAIYELLVKEKADGEHYEDRIKSLKGKYPLVDDIAIDVLAHIQGMTSDKVHEQSWPHWDSKHLRLIIEALKSVLDDIYVAPRIREERAKMIQELRQQVPSATDKPNS